MNDVKRILLFLLINFGGLAFGSWLMDNGPTSAWYVNLNKAPWTPSGWVFGFAWTTIMICFSIFLSKLFREKSHVKTKTLFCIQVLLNVSWNYLFFNKHLVLLSLINITSLTVVIFYFFFYYKKEVKNIRFLLMPYMIWLLIATSLNAYILLYN